MRHGHQWRFSIFVLVELAWNNAGKRTGSSNHEKKNNNSNAGQVRSGPVSAPGAAVMSRLQFTTGAGHRRVRAHQMRPMRSRHPPCRRQQRSWRASLHKSVSSIKRMRAVVLSVSGIKRTSRRTSSPAGRWRPPLTVLGACQSNAARCLLSRTHIRARSVRRRCPFSFSHGSLDAYIIALPH